MIRHTRDREYDVIGVCREKSVARLDDVSDRITIVPGATSDREVIRRALEGCNGVLTLLVPWGVEQYATGTAQSVPDHAPPQARVG